MLSSSLRFFSGSFLCLELKDKKKITQKWTYFAWCNGNRSFSLLWSCGDFFVLIIQWQLSKSSSGWRGLKEVKRDLTVNFMLISNVNTSRMYIWCVRLIKKAKILPFIHCLLIYSLAIATDAIAYINNNKVTMLFIMSLLDDDAEDSGPRNIFF